MYTHIGTLKYICYNDCVPMLFKEENMQKIEDRDNKEVSINVRVNDKDKRIFYQICEQMGMTPSKVVRKLLEEFCENNSGKKKLL